MTFVCPLLGSQLLSTSSLTTTAVILGAHWKMEPPSVREHYKALADDIKAKLLELHPDYQYSPRKPGEKKRRAKKVLNDGVSGSLHEGRTITLPSFSKEGFNSLRKQERESTVGSRVHDCGTTAAVAPVTESARVEDFSMLK